MSDVGHLAGAVREVKDLLRERLDESNRLDDHEQRLQALERRRKH